MGTVTGTVERAGCAWLRYDYGSSPLTGDEAGPFTMWRYRALLPLAEGPVRFPVPIGGTPLLSAPSLRRDLGMPRLWLKDETRNPTASNKDRATALVIEGGLRDGVDTITTASTGNAAVATAFGAAAAGMRAVIFVSTDCRAEKLALMAQAGAWVCRVPAGYAAAVDLSRAAARALGWLDRNTGANPVTVEAKKTVAFEIWEQLGRTVPDVVVAPVGDGPTLVALEKGFDELLDSGLATRRPRLIGVQADRCQPLVLAWQGREGRPDQLDPAATVADGIAVLRPATGEAVLAAVRRDGGGLVAVPEEAFATAVTVLASRAGVGAEPAGASALAGLLRATDDGLVDRSETVVLLITGRGMPSPRAQPALDRVQVVEDLDGVERFLAGAP